MGNCSDKLNLDKPKFDAVYYNFPDVAVHKREFRCLNLTQAEVGQFYKKYRKIDTDGSGTIEILEFLMWLGDWSWFIKEVINLFTMR